MLRLKLQYFGHLMGRADSFEKTLMLEKNEGRRRRSLFIPAKPHFLCFIIPMRGKAEISFMYVKAFDKTYHKRCGAWYRKWGLNNSTALVHIS